MRRGYTEAPCHGCGTTEIHKREKLCNECQRKLDKYEAILLEQKARGEEGARPFIMKERDYALPYFHNMKRDGSDALRRAFFDLSWVLSLPTELRVPYKQNVTDKERQKYTLWPLDELGSIRSSDWDCTRLMDPPVALHLRTLCKLVAEGLRDAYRKGVDDGRNLLFSLADGSLTTDEFNNKAARIEERGL